MLPPFHGNVESNDDVPDAPGVHDVQEVPDVPGWQFWYEKKAFVDMQSWVLLINKSWFQTMIFIHSHLNSAISGWSTIVYVEQFSFWGKANILGEETFIFIWCL